MNGSDIVFAPAFPVTRAVIGYLCSCYVCDDHWFFKKMILDQPILGR